MDTLKSTIVESSSHFSMFSHHEKIQELEAMVDIRPTLMPPNKLWIITLLDNVTSTQHITQDRHNLMVLLFISMPNITLDAP